jgi:hypothetical protein
MNKTYAFSDIHGNYKLWEQIKNYCDETDTIYFLGDAIDRGEDGIKIFNELFFDKRVKMIKGNHEDMLATCVPEFIEGTMWNYGWWASNGGRPTWEALEKCSDDSKMWYVHIINSLPTYMWYNSPHGHRILLTHAGTDLRWTEKERAMFIDEPYLWDRKHFSSPHPPSMPNVYQVHGHTPTIFLAEELGLSDEAGAAIISYCGGHKIDIDCCTIISRKVALLDLDTFEPIYFTEKE